MKMVLRAYNTLLETVARAVEELAEGQDGGYVDGVHAAADRVLAHIVEVDK